MINTLMPLQRAIGWSPARTITGVFFLGMLCVAFTRLQTLSDRSIADSVVATQAARPAEGHEPIEQVQNTRASESLDVSLNTLEALGTAAHVSLSNIRPDESNKALILTTIARYEAQVSFLQSLFKRYPSSMGSFMDSTGEFSTNLSVTNYEYGCTDFDSTPGCQVAPLKRYFPYMSRMTETAKDLTGKVLPSEESTTVYDCDNTPVKCFGNATKVTIKTTGTDGGVYTKETVSDFYNDEANWMLGKLLRSKVTSTIPATP